MVYQNYNGSVLCGHYFSTVRKISAHKVLPAQRVNKKSWWSFDPFTRLFGSSEWTEWGCVCDCSRSASWAVSPGCLGIWGLTAPILHALTPRQAQTPFSWVFVFQPVSWWVASQICSSLTLAGICVKRPWCWPHRVPSGTPCPQAFSREGSWPWELGRGEEWCSHFLLCWWSFCHSCVQTWWNFACCYSGLTCLCSFQKPGWWPPMSPRRPCSRPLSVPQTALGRRILTARLELRWLGHNLVWLDFFFFFFFFW